MARLNVASATEDAWGSYVSLILRLSWGLWHMPKFFVGDGVVTVIIFCIYTAVLAVVFTTLYNSCGGNLFIVTLFHAASNEFVIKLLPGLDEVDGNEIYVALLWLLVTILVTLTLGARKLTRQASIASA